MKLLVVLLVLVVGPGSWANQSLRIDLDRDTAIDLAVDRNLRSVSILSIAQMLRPKVQIEKSHYHEKLCERLSENIAEGRLPSIISLSRPAKLNIQIFESLEPLHGAGVVREISRKSSINYTYLKKFSFLYSYKISEQNVTVKLLPDSMIKKIEKLQIKKTVGDRDSDRVSSKMENYISRINSDAMSTMEDGTYKVETTILPLVCDLMNEKVDIDYSFAVSYPRLATSPSAQEKRQARQLMDEWKMNIRKWEATDVAEKSFLLGASLHVLDPLDGLKRKLLSKELLNSLDLNKISQNKIDSYLPIIESSITGKFSAESWEDFKINLFNKGGE